MTPSPEPHAQIGECTPHREIPARNNSSTTYIECPRTPENRAAPRINLPPGPKSDSGHRKEQDSPVQTLLHRTHYRRSDSGYSSRESSTDPINIKENLAASCSEYYGKELSKTPARNNAAFQDLSKSRSASPKKCPSVDRRRLQSRYHRVRSPPIKRPERVLFPIVDMDETVGSIFGVELTR